MDMKGSTCKQCEKKYHHCGSCGDMNTAGDNGFCSTKCLIASQKFKSAKANAQAFFDSLTPAQKVQFEKFQSDESDYEYMSLYEEKKNV